jgi:signal transduction histidine kinase
MLQFAGLVGIYTLADLGRPWQRRGFLTAIFLTFPPASVFVKHNTAAEFMATLLLPLTAYLLGSLVRTSRIRGQARAEQSERERTAEAAREVAQERARIAREMHDVLAHAVSVMVVQAEAGPLFTRSDPDRTEQIFEVIASVGRGATDQLARTLDLLKGENDVGMRTPQPTVAEVPALVDLMQRAGLQVGLRTGGDSRPLPAEAEVAAYRIVQEAMTNTVRHAGAASADVQLDWQQDGLLITVTDDGRTSASVTHRSGGHGLVGIHERARACGGHAETGPGSNGGFRITAWLPYSVSVSSGVTGMSGR